MNSTIITVKTDKKIKDAAKRVANELGFPLSTLLNAYLRQLIKRKSIHFSLEDSYEMSHTLEKELEVFEKDIKEKKNISKSFNNANEALSHLKM